jgi:hypothetical protein
MHKSTTDAPTTKNSLNVETISTKLVTPGADASEMQSTVPLDHEKLNIETTMTTTTTKFRETTLNSLQTTAIKTSVTFSTTEQTKIANTTKNALTSSTSPKSSDLRTTTMTAMMATTTRLKSSTNKAELSTIEPTERGKIVSGNGTANFGKNATSSENLMQSMHR